MNTPQILAALRATPKGGAFKWPSSDPTYVKQLAANIGRRDIQIILERKP